MQNGTMGTFGILQDGPIQSASINTSRPDGGAGRLDLAIRYSGKARGKQDRRMKLTVNGKVIDDDLLFPNTNDWGSSWKTISVNIPFDRGANTIRLTTIENGGMYIDEMSIVPSP